MDTQDTRNTDVPALRPGLSVIVIILVAVSVGIGALFLFNYFAPFAGGKRDVRALLAGAGVFTGIGVLLIFLWTRPSTCKVARLCAVSTVVALAYLGYLMSNGIELPDSAVVALETFMDEQGIEDYTVSYVWQGPIRDHPHYITPYCVIVDPGLDDGRNAFIVDQVLGAGYQVLEGSPTEATWRDLGCGHVDDVTNSSFDR